MVRVQRRRQGIEIQRAVRRLTNEGELRRYVAEVNGYGVARVALRQGAETLSIYLGEVAAIATSDVCIK